MATARSPATLATALFTPEAIPECSPSTEPSATVVIGVIASAIPKP